MEENSSVPNKQPSSAAAAATADHNHSAVPNSNVQHHGAAFPAQPGAAFPAQPGAAFPAQPGAAFPAQPGAAFHAQPGAAFPAQPGAAFPAQPFVAFHAQPAAASAHPFHPNSSQQPPFPGVAYVGSNMNQMMMVQRQNVKEPAQMMCPHCKYAIITTTKHINGRLTYLVCATMGVFLLWPFCLIPLCVKTCKDVEHSCPVCLTVIHVHKRL